MVKGGKRYSSVSNDGKWVRNIFLSHWISSLETTVLKPGCQKSRDYPFSNHDNKHALKDNISLFTEYGVGRRKCLDDRRQHNSHFCLCHDGADSNPQETRMNLTAYQSDFLVKQPANVPTSTRRFPRNHKQKSAEAALAQAGAQIMWFGRHDSNLPETLEVLAATNFIAPSKP
uniref:Testis expressed 36 n=1 Tax=Mastacembelus armatus TaxID=205130 RepID=A0A3Q3SJG7_9TELE